jgi:hypothetical protein
MACRNISSKKGAVAPHTVVIIWRLIYLVIVFFGIIVLVNSVVVKDENTFPVEAELLVQRLIYAPRAVSHYDDIINRVYPRIISFEDFADPKTPARLERVIEYKPDPHISAKLTLKEVGGNEIYTMYYHKEHYQKWKVHAYRGATGPGSASLHKRSVPVVIDNNYTVQKHILEERREIYMMDRWLRDKVVEIEEELENLDERKAQQHRLRVLGQLDIDVIMPNS